MFYLSLDLGQAQDPSALAIIERVGVATDIKSHLRHLKRYPLRTPYPSIVSDVKDLVKNPKVGKNPALIVDATGVGAPVVDMFLDAGLNPIQIKIHGGDKVIYDGPECRVPKRDLASAIQYFLQNDLLLCPTADKLPMVEVLIREMMAFKVKISTRGHDSYEAWREGDHDDLVLAVAMACWYIQVMEQGEDDDYDYLRNTEGWPETDSDDWVIRY